MNFLKTNPTELRTKDLENFKVFKEFISSISKKNKTETKGSKAKEIETEEAPEEALEYAYQKLKTDLSRDLLDTIKSCSHFFFENLVVDLLTKMGYGGSLHKPGKLIS